ncbi:MAG: hypothetical protein ACLQDY_00545 [Streptosporangiaceae bacterium]|jgi:hypothetical protein
MSPMKAMAVRRWRWRREMQTNPLDWDQPYSWLRAELADLERARKASRLLRLRTAVPAWRIRRETTRLFLRCAARLDAAIPADPAELARCEDRRREMASARTEDERTWRARGWLMSSEIALGCDGTWRPVAALLTARLAALAESVARLRKDG